MHLDAKPNEYQETLERLFDKTPKAVFAAIAVSFLKRLGGGESDTDTPAAIQAAILNEWSILHANGIVPQKPSKA